MQQLNVIPEEEKANGQSSRRLIEANSSFGLEGLSPEKHSAGGSSGENPAARVFAQNDNLPARSMLNIP